MKLIWRMMRALCAGDGEARQWLAVIDYLVAENRVLHELLWPTARPFLNGVGVKPGCTRSNRR